MVILISQELCAGCGVCLDACPVGAIHWMDQRAVIDDGRCTQCEACIDACPNGAITALSVPARSVPIAAQPAPDSRMIPTPIQIVQTETSAPSRGLAPRLGAALAFLGSEVAPRLADALIAALERRLARPAATAATPVLTTSSQNPTRTGRGMRRKARCRGGRNFAGNHNGYDPHRSRKPLT